MGLLPVSTDYTDKDFDSIKLRLQNLVRSVFPEWTDYNAANFGNILLELYAFVGDVLTYYQDSQAKNSRISTADQRRALLGLVKLIGYSPGTATAATADVEVTIAASPVAAARIAAGVNVATREVTNRVRYQLLTEVVFAAGTSVLTQTVACENSVTRSASFTSNGLANQVFVLGQTPYLDATAVLVAGNGTYSQVDNFLASTPADLHFTITVDQNDRATVRTGNGVNGVVPVGDITVGYKTGGGTTGRVEIGKLVNLEGAFLDDDGAPARYTVTNPSASSSGTDREGVSQIKLNAPASIRVVNRTVALEDYEIHAEGVSGVTRALMLTADQDAGVAENSGILFVIPSGGGVPTTALKDAVLTAVTVTYPNTITFSTVVQDPSYKTVNVSARVGILQGFTKTDVKAAIVTALTAFFAVEDEEGTPNANINFGGKIKDSAGVIVSELVWSDVANVVRDISGVRKLVPDQFFLNLAVDDVALTTREFPQLGTVTVIDDDTALVIT